MTDPLYQAKRPVTILAGPYGHPVHPILVTVPIGAWVTGLVFDIASRLVGDPVFLTKGVVWLIAIGIAGALAAAMAGFLDLFAIPTGTPAFRTGVMHMTLTLAVTAAYAANLAWRLGGYDHQSRVTVAQIVLSAVSLAALAVAGFLGGRLAFSYGVRVADETTQAHGYRPSEDR